MHRNEIDKLRLETALNKEHGIAGSLPHEYFELIKYVVSNYPGFRDEEYGFDAEYPEQHAATLFAAFGMKIFADMYDTAVECDYARKQVIKAKETYDKVIKDMKEYRINQGRVTKEDMSKMWNLNLVPKKVKAVAHASAEKNDSDPDSLFTCDDVEEE